MKRTNFLLILILLSIGLFAQPYKIKVKIKGLANKDLQLAYYYEDKQLIESKITLDKNATGTFEGENKLHGGIYLVIYPKGNEYAYFDILISEDQEFFIKSDTSDILQNMKISGSLENEIFIAHQLKMKAIQAKSEKLNKKLEEFKDNPDSLKIINTQIETLKNSESNAWKSIVKQHPELFFSRLLTAMNSEHDPQSGLSPDEFMLSVIDFSDTSFIRTPILYKVMRQVIARTLKTGEQNIINEIDKLIEHSKANEKVYQYVVTYLLNFYNTFKKIGMNVVFVHIAENYFLDGKCDWLTAEALKQIEERKDVLKSNFPGQIAKDLRMETAKDEFVSLHELDTKYTLLYFWKTGCGHCAESSEILKKFYDEVRAESSIEVFAVFTRHSKNEWKDYIKEHDLEWINCWDPDNQTNYGLYYDVYSTPILYLLDHDKRIVARRVGPGQIEELLNQLRKQREKYKMD